MKRHHSAKVWRVFDTLNSSSNGGLELHTIDHLLQREHSSIQFLNASVTLPIHSVNTWHIYNFSTKKIRKPLACKCQVCCCTCTFLSSCKVHPRHLESEVKPPIRWHHAYLLQVFKVFKCDDSKPITSLADSSPSSLHGLHLPSYVNVSLVLSVPI